MERPECPHDLPLMGSDIPSGFLASLCMIAGTWQLSSSKGPSVMGCGVRCHSGCQRASDLCAVQRVSGGAVVFSCHTSDLSRARHKIIATAESIACSGREACVCWTDSSESRFSSHSLRGEISRSREAIRGDLDPGDIFQ